MSIKNLREAVATHLSNNIAGVNVYCGYPVLRDVDFDILIIVEGNLDSYVRFLSGEISVYRIEILVWAKKDRVVSNMRNMELATYYAGVIKNTMDSFIYTNMVKYSLMSESIEAYNDVLDALGRRLIYTFMVVD